MNHSDGLDRAAGVDFRVSPPVDDPALNGLFAASWPGHAPRRFGPVLARSLAYVCAYDAGRLVGFVNVAWDGDLHAFLLDTTVHPDRRRRGIGRGLAGRAADAARGAGVAWLHVDFEPHLRDFYRACGFRPTDAGLIGFEPGLG